MDRIKKSCLFRAISFVLILTFISLDISYAYPPEHNLSNSTLSAPSVLQQQPVTEYAARFQQSVFSQSALIASVYDIGEYFFGNADKSIGSLPSKYVEEAMRADLGKHLSDADTEILNIVPVEYIKETAPDKLRSALDEIGFKGTLPDEGVVFILYRKAGKKFLVQIARKDQVSSDSLPGYEWVVSDKYVVKYMPEDYVAPQGEILSQSKDAGLAVLPQSSSPVIARPAEQAKARLLDKNAPSVGQVISSSNTSKEAPKVTITEPIAQIELPNSSVPSAKKIINAKAIIASLFILMLIPSQAFASDVAAYDAGIVGWLIFIGFIASPFLLIKIGCIISSYIVKLRHKNKIEWVHLQVVDIQRSPSMESGVGGVVCEQKFGTEEEKWVIRGSDEEMIFKAVHEKSVDEDNPDNCFYTQVDEIETKWLSKAESIYSINPLAAIFGVAVLGSVFSSLKDLTFAHPMITGIAGLGIGVAAFFTIWRVFFPVSWYLSRLESKKSDVRLSAIKTLGEIKTPRAVEPIIGELLRSKHIGEMEPFIAALSSINDVRTTRLLSMLKDLRTRLQIHPGSFTFDLGVAKDCLDADAEYRIDEDIANIPDKFYPAEMRTERELIPSQPDYSGAENYEEVYKTVVDREAYTEPRHVEYHYVLRRTYPSSLKKKLVDVPQEDTHVSSTGTNATERQIQPVVSQALVTKKSTFTELCQGAGDWANRPVPHSDFERIAVLKDVSARKLIIIDINSSFMGINNFSEINDEALDAVVNLLKAGKKVMLFSNEHHSKIKGLVENSFRRYINKKQRLYDAENIGFATFKDCYLYTNQGRCKYIIDTVMGEYVEDESYRENIPEDDRDKIRTIVDEQVSGMDDKNLFGQRNRTTVTYTRKSGFVEEFDIYGLSADEKDAILKKAKELEDSGMSMRILVNAIPYIIKDPRVMLNMSEQPSMFFLLYGLLDSSFYYREDGDFSKRQALMDRLSGIFTAKGIKCVIELSGSRSFSFGMHDKEKVIQDAQKVFGLNPKDSVVIADFSAKEESIFDLVRDRKIAVVNIGNHISGMPNPILQLKYIYSCVGGIFWMTLLYDLNSSLDSKKASLFVERLVSVYEMLLAHPEMPSEDIADYFKITKEELINIYRYIGRLDGLRMPLIFDSQYKEHTMELDRIFRDRNRLRKVIKGEVVYPVVVEMHLGPFCNSNCAMCFSHGSEYPQIEVNERHKVIDRRLSELDELLKFVPADGSGEIASEIARLKLEKSELPLHKEELSLDEMRTFFEDFKKGGVEEIWFSGGKEPLMAGKKAVDAIRIANEMGFRTRLYTNGELIDKWGAMEVLLGCEQVRISMNAATPETYDAIHFPEKTTAKIGLYRRDGKKVFARVKKNLENFIALRNNALKDQSRPVKPRVKIAISQIIQPLNHHELTQFYEMANRMGADSVQVRAESVGNVTPFTEKQKQDIINQDQGLRRRKAVGEFPDMRFESRGLSKEDLDASKDAEQFLAGMRKASLCRAGTFKRGINPWGVVHNCEFSMHPRNANDPRYYELGTEIGDLRVESFGQIMSKVAGSFLLNRCPRCQANEYGMNITLEKLSRDFNWGIDIENQPYYNEADYFGDIAVVGLGRWSSTTVIPALLDTLPRGSRILGVARSNFDEINKTFAGTGKVTVVNSDYLDELLNDQSVSAVVVTTDFDSHYDVVKKALLKGKDVFVEKPFTRTPEEAGELNEIARQNGLILAVGYEYMNEPDFFKLREVLGSGIIGSVREVRMNMLNNVGGRKLDYSSNVIEDLIGHQMSMLMTFFGEEDVSIRGCKLQNDAAEIEMTYGEKKVSISVDRDYKGSFVRTVELIGDKGQIILDYGTRDRSVRFRIYDEAGRELTKEDKAFPRLLDEQTSKRFLVSEFEMFIEAVRTRKAPYNSAQAVTLITDTVEKLNRMAFASLSAPDAGRYINDFHWDFESALNYMWDDRMESGNVFKYDIKNLNSKRVGRFNALYIPGRAKKRKMEKEAPTTIYAPFNSSDFNFNSGSIDVKERLMSLSLHSGSMDILVNINPFKKSHFIAVPDPGLERPQYITSRDMMMAMELISMSRTSRFKLIYNSRGAYASVNQMHFQGFLYEDGDDNMLPIEKADKEKVVAAPDLKVFRLQDFPAKAVVFQSSDARALALSASAYVRILEDSNIPHNLIITKGSIYVIPRTFEKKYSLDSEDHLMAALELAGECVFHNENAYEGADESEIASAMSGVNISEEVFDGTIAVWKQAYDADQRLIRGATTPEEIAGTLGLVQLKSLIVMLGIEIEPIHGKFVSYSGSSGAGKTSMWNLMIAGHRDMFEKALLYTTRPRRFKSLKASDGMKFEKLKRFMQLKEDTDARAFIDSVKDGDVKAFLAGPDGLRPIFDASVYGRIISKNELLEDCGDTIHVFNEFEDVQYHFTDQTSLEKMEHDGKVIVVKVKEMFQGFPIEEIKSAVNTNKIRVLEVDKELLFSIFKPENAEKLKRASIDLNSLDLTSFFVLTMDREDIKRLLSSYSLESTSRDISRLLTWSNGSENEIDYLTDAKSLVSKISYIAVAKLLDRFSVVDIRKAFSVIGAPVSDVGSAEKKEVRGFDKFLHSEELKVLNREASLRSETGDLLSKRSMFSEREISCLLRMSYIFILEMTRRLKMRANFKDNIAFRYDKKYIERIADSLEENFFAYLHSGNSIKDNVLNRWKDDGIPNVAVESFSKSIFANILKNLVSDIRTRQIKKINVIAASIIDEVKKKGKLSFREMFAIAQSRVPDSIRNLSEALRSLEPISRQGGMVSEAISNVIAEVSSEYELSAEETKILWLALTGLEQGMGEDAKSQKESDDLAQPEVVQASKATQLFEIVESSLSNERSKFIDSGNELIGSFPAKSDSEAATAIGVLDKDMATAEIRQRVERAIVAIESLGKEDTAPETSTAIEFLKKNLNQFEADGAVGSLIVLARKAKKENQKLIIGLETDWIPGINVKNSLQRQAIAALMKEIDGIAEALQSMGLDNVEVIRGSGKQLADAILAAKEAGNAPTKMHNIVVMASANTINSDDFAYLRNADESDRPFLTGIDPTELIKLYTEFGESVSKQLYIRLANLFYMTLELAAGKEPPQSPIIISYDKKLRILILLPKADLIDYEMLKNAYTSEKVALSAA